MSDVYLKTAKKAVLPEHHNGSGICPRCKKDVKIYLHGEMSYRLSRHLDLSIAPAKGYEGGQICPGSGSVVEITSV